MCHDFFSHTGQRREAGRKGPFDGGFGAFWGGPGRAGWGGMRGGGRMFGQGDLKYVILQLLDEKPRHGYEIIKELEDRFAGTYSPSPGTVYPTLTMLEDLGYAKAIPEEGGRRIFEITPQGKAYLAEHRETVDDIFERVAQFSAGFFGGPMTEVHAAFKDVARAAYSRAMRSTTDAERLRKIREILERTAKELDGLGA